MIAISSYSTCRFSQLLLLLSFKHILFNISLARFRLSAVLLPCSLDRIFLLLLWRFSFLSRLSRSRICLSTPTRSSSTLCWIPLDVSMNLHSLDVASCLPSLKEHQLFDHQNTHTLFLLLFLSLSLSLSHSFASFSRSFIKFAVRDLCTNASESSTAFQLLECTLKLWQISTKSSVSRPKGEGIDASVSDRSFHCLKYIYVCIAIHVWDESRV